MSNPSLNIKTFANLHKTLDIKNSKIKTLADFNKKDDECCNPIQKTNPMQINELMVGSDLNAWMKNPAGKTLGGVRTQNVHKARLSYYEIASKNTSEKK